LSRLSRQFSQTDSFYILNSNQPAVLWLITLTSVVTKAVDAETEAKTEAVYPKTEAEAQGSWPILLTVLSSGAVLAQKF